MNDDASDGPDTPAVREYLGAAYPALRHFADLLADQGVSRGLIGPREVPRLWDRHLLNSAAVAQYLPAQGTLVDVGTGAGLPGVVLACMRPDLHTVLLEPMERRVVWLREVLEELGLGSAEVVRGRAEEVRLGSLASAVTARAVAPMDRLVTWTLPLLEVGGVLLAMKGDRAAEEAAAAQDEIARLGGAAAEVLTATTIAGATPTVVVRVVKERAAGRPTRERAAAASDTSRAVRRGAAAGRRGKRADGSTPRRGARGRRGAAD